MIFKKGTYRAGMQNLKLFGNNIPRATKVEYLGVTLDSNSHGEKAHRLCAGAPEKEYVPGTSRWSDSSLETPAAELLRYASHH
ncbi:hypothetical protein TNCV_946281 [Trichonephila clavipes]|nr:hypothetical protein TNCV_946281 [Trichonephila clavipes]